MALPNRSSPHTPCNNAHPQAPESVRSLTTPDSAPRSPPVLPSILRRAHNSGTRMTWRHPSRRSPRQCIRQRSAAPRQSRNWPPVRTGFASATAPNRSVPGCLSGPIPVPCLSKLPPGSSHSARFHTGGTAARIPQSVFVCFACRFLSFASTQLSVQAFCY